MNTRIIANGQEVWKRSPEFQRKVTELKQTNNISPVQTIH